MAKNKNESKIGGTKTSTFFKKIASMLLTLAIGTSVGVTAGVAIEKNNSNENASETTISAEYSAESELNEFYEYLEKVTSRYSTSGMIDNNSYQILTDKISNMQYVDEATKQRLIEMVEQTQNYSTQAQELTQANNSKRRSYANTSLSSVLNRDAQEKANTCFYIPMTDQLSYNAEYDISSLNYNQQVYMSYVKSIYSKQISSTLSESGCSNATIDAIKCVADYSSSVDSALSNTYTSLAGNADEDTYSDLYADAVSINESKATLDSIDYSAISDDYSTKLQNVVYLKSLDTNTIYKSCSYEIGSAGIDEMNNIIEEATEAFEQMKNGNLDASELSEKISELKEKLTDFLEVSDNLIYRYMSATEQNEIKANINQMNAKAQKLLSSIKEFENESNMTASNGEEGPAME